MHSVRIVDARFIPLASSIWLSTAGTVIVGLQRNPSALILWLTAICLVALSLVWWHRHKQLSYSAITKVMFCGALLGLGLALTRVLPITQSSLVVQAQHHSVVDFTATVVSDPTLLPQQDKLTWNSATRVSMRMRLESISAPGVVIDTKLPIQLFATRYIDQYLHLTPGTRISAVGRLDLPRPGSAFVAYLTALTEPKTQTGPPRYQWLATALRERLVKALSRTPNDAKALVPGLALGDTRAMRSELLAEMRTSGLTHLVAVSGANVTILLALVFTALARTSRSTQVAGATLALAAFEVVVRPQPSVLRASAMGLVLLLGILGKRKTDAINALAVAVVVLVIIDPLISATYGFALSVCATAGLLMGSEKLRNVMTNHLPKAVPDWVVDGLVVTVCAQCAVLPILLQLGATFSLAAVPANLLAVPLALLTMVLGLILTGVAVICLPLAQVFAWVVAIPALGIATIARIASSATFLIVPIPNGLLGAFLATSFVVSIVFSSTRWPRFNPNQKSLIVLTAIVAISAIWIHPLTQLRMWPTNNWLLVSCDVGQGDATVINLGHHQAIVIDVGPDPNLLDKCLTALHIKAIPLLILTHFHADHVSGLDAVFHRRKVGMIRVTSLADPPLTTTFVTGLLASKSLSAQAMTAGEHLAINEVDLECLWPAEIIRGQGSDANNASIVLLAKIHGHTFLLAGDVEAPAQKAITQRYHLPHVEFLKMAHHGSRNQDVQFARDLSPDITFISVGKDNGYGHPAAETLMLYEVLGTKIYRTDRSGNLAVVESGGMLKVMTSR